MDSEDIRAIEEADDMLLELLSKKGDSPLVGKEIAAACLMELDRRQTNLVRIIN